MPAGSTGAKVTTDGVPAGSTGAKVTTDGVPAGSTGAKVTTEVDGESLMSPCKIRSWKDFLLLWPWSWLPLRPKFGTATVEEIVSW